MTRLLNTLQSQDTVNEFVTDVFNVTTIALVSVLGLLTVAATI